MVTEWACPQLVRAIGIHDITPGQYFSHKHKAFELVIAFLINIHIFTDFYRQGFNPYENNCGIASIS